MRQLLMILILSGSLSAAFADATMKGSVAKVLPLYLDLKGRAALSPSLFDRDAYQAYLRQNTNEISAIRFDVLWRVSNADDNPDLKLRIELRGAGPDGLPRETKLEEKVTPHYFRRWTSFTLGDKDLKNFGNVTSWHATLWAGDRMLAEQKSFLW